MFLQTARRRDHRGIVPATVCYAGIAWAHFDLYAWNDQTSPGRPEGGEAYAMRALFQRGGTRWLCTAGLNESGQVTRVRPKGSASAMELT